MEVIRICEESLPLSLRQCCLLHVVVNFNKFPVALLAHLPISLRRTILAHLPGTVLHELEGTGFVDGVDVAALWRQLYIEFKERLPVPSDEGKFVKSPSPDYDESEESAMINGKASILDSAVTTVFGYNLRCSCRCNLPVAVLMMIRNVSLRSETDDTTVHYDSSSSPSVDAVLKCFNLKVICLHCNILAVAETVKNSVIYPLDFERYSVTCIKFLVSIFNKYPKMIESSKLTVKTVYGHQDIMEFISQTESLCLCSSHTLPAESSKKFFDYFSSMLGHGGLKTLLINTELSGDQLHYVTPLFSGRSSNLASLCYNGLKQLSAGKFLKQEKHPAGQKNAIADVSSIISFQNNLHRVRLYGYFGFSSASENLMSCLCKLVKQPQFESLMVEGYNNNCSLSIERFCKIIFCFLSDEAKNFQYLKFTAFQLVNTKVSFFKLAKLSQSVLLKLSADTTSKRMDITGVCLPVEAVQLFSQVQQQICFHTLKLSLTAATEYYLELSNLFNSHRYTLTQDSVSETAETPSSIESVSKQVAHFILKPDIQFLILNSVCFNTLNACKIIAQALSSKAAASHSLTTIHFIDCFGQIKQADCLEIMFKGLIALAQSVELELNFEDGLFSGRFMSKEHVDLLNKTWTSFDVTPDWKKQRIHKFRCTLYNAGEDQLLKMEEVTENLIPVFKHFDEKVFV